MHEKRADNGVTIQLPPAEQTAGPVSPRRRGRGEALVGSCCWAYLVVVLGCWLLLYASDLWWPATLFLFSPRWLFFVPGLVVFVLGILIGAVVIPRPFSIGSVTFDVDTLVAASAMVVIGFQSVLFALFTQVYASAEGFLPEDKRVRHILKTLSLERGLLAGGVLGVAGTVGLIVSFFYWNSTRFGSLNYDHALRLVVPSATALIVSCQIILGTFFLSILGIRRTRHPAMGALETDEEGREAAPGKVSRSRADGAVGTVGTVGVDAGAAAGVPAQASANGGQNAGQNAGSVNGGKNAGDDAGVPAGAGRDVHAAGSDGA